MAKTTLFSKLPVRGSYNICYFVHFQSKESENDGGKWVLCVPLAPCLAEGCRTKLEREGATMQYILEHTTIPIPKIHAYNLGDGSHPLSSYMILECIEGVVLSHKQLTPLMEEQWKNLYMPLAYIHIQSIRLEFPSIGCLAKGPDGITVRKTVATMDTNLQEPAGVNLSIIQTSFHNTSANNYVASLPTIADTAFAQGQNSGFNRKKMEDALYHLHIFREYVHDKCLNPQSDKATFVLVHGDLEPFHLVVNASMEIFFVLDWEWSRIVPLQFFKPPLWYRNLDTTKLTYNFVYQDYLKSCNRCLDIVRTRTKEKEKYGCGLLAGEWEKAKGDSGFLVANALESSTDVDWYASRDVDWKCFKRKGEVGERVKELWRRIRSVGRLLSGI